MKNASKSIRSKAEKLIASVWRSNIKLAESGLTPLTWGNVSQVDREAGLIAIKPSGIAYAKLRPQAIVLTDFSGKPVASKLRPSTDLPTHLVLYRAFPALGAVLHVHSVYATAFAQACHRVPCLGTTHADYFPGAIPVTDSLTASQIQADYEKMTGEIIVKKIRQLKMDPRHCPFILVAHHGPFVWGKDANAAVENAIALEYICKTAFLTALLNPKIKSAPPALIQKHFSRKHGPKAYYGQKSWQK